MIALYRMQQLREFEQHLYTQNICNAVQLMENAGQAAFQCLLQHWPQAQHIIVACGKGNNGGDGLVVARLAHEQGFKVEVYSSISLEEHTKEAALALTKALDAGLELKPFKPHMNWDADVIVDALLGSGVHGEVRGPLVEIITDINTSDSPVLSLDVPSGLNSDSGQVLGCAVHADVTITFIAPKQGLFTAHAPAYCGEIISDSIGVPADQLSSLNPTAKQFIAQDIKAFLPRRSRSAHKGDYGHVLVVGGDYGMGGAVRMAAEAAMRVGAGLVSVATRPEHVPIVNSCRPEIMCQQITTADDLLPLLPQASVIVIGPGLGKSEWALSLLNKVLQQPVLKVIDADALNLLALQPSHSDEWVLTPHPGEAGRLLGIGSREIQNERFAAAQKLQQQYGGVVVLKGAGTIIQCENSLPLVCSAGNPGMATGGMGDILSGIIAGLLAQQLTLQQAAQAGVMIHALAADKAVQQGGGERGLLATDLLGFLRELVNPF